MRVNPLTKFCKQNELGKLREDQCYIDRRDEDSRKPFALTTYHYHPYGSKVRSTCYPGQFYNDGHISGANVDADSKVSRNPGFEMTNPNVHQELPMLPVQLPQVKGWHNADTESSLRSEIVYKDPACRSTSEKSLIPYQFEVFDGLCYNPQEPKYIIP